MKRGDLDGYEKHATAAIALDRKPKEHEFSLHGERNPDIRDANLTASERDAQKIAGKTAAVRKVVKTKKRDAYWKNRAQETRRTRWNAAKKHGCAPTARKIGRAAANERRAVRQAAIFGNILAADGKEKFTVTIYTSADALMQAEGKTADQLAGLVGNYWKRATSARAGTTAKASKAERDAAKTVKKSAKAAHDSIYILVRKSGKESVVMPIRATSNVIRALENLQHRNPGTVGNPLFCSFAEKSPFAAAERVGEAITKAAYCGKPQKAAPNRPPEQEQPVRAQGGGGGNGGGGGAPATSGREDPPERSGAFPAGELGHYDDIWDVDLRFLSDMERERVLNERERAMEQ